MRPDGEEEVSVAAAVRLGLVGVQVRRCEPGREHALPQVRIVTAVHRWAAAYMTLGLSLRVSSLDRLDSADVYRGRHHRKPQN